MVLKGNQVTTLLGGSKAYSKTHEICVSSLRTAMTQTLKHLKVCLLLMTRPLLEGVNMTRLHPIPLQLKNKSSWQLGGVKKSLHGCRDDFKETSWQLSGVKKPARVPKGFSKKQVGSWAVFKPTRVPKCKKKKKNNGKTKKRGGQKKRGGSHSRTLTLEAEAKELHSPLGLDANLENQPHPRTKPGKHHLESP